MILSRLILAGVSLRLGEDGKILAGPRGETGFPVDFGLPMLLVDRKQRMGMVIRLVWLR